MEHDATHGTRWPYALVAALAAVGAVLGALAYFGAETGVDGTAGALLALIGAVAVGLGAALAAWRHLPRGGLTPLNVLLVLGTLLTAFAAWMLMQYAFTAAMAASFLALLVALAARRWRVAA